MEIPLGKVLTTPPISSLGRAPVTASAKRRQTGGRVIRHFSLEMFNRSADVLFLTEGSTDAVVKGETVSGSAGS